MNDTLVRNALYGLTAIVLVALAGIIFLSADDRTPPDVLEQAVTAGVVAIAAILPGAMNRRVEIDQPRHDPIPVADVGERGASDAAVIVAALIVALIVVLLVRGGI